MTGHQPRAAATVVVTAALAMAGLAGCSSASGSKAAHRQQQANDTAAARAELSALQFVIDTQAVPAASIPTHVLADGVVTSSVDTRLLYQSQEKLYIGPADRTTVADETARATTVLATASLTTEQQARVIVVQELADGGFLDARTFGAGAAGGTVRPGAEVDGWVAAHSADPLTPGSSTTVGVEVARVLRFITMPVSALAG